MIYYDRVSKIYADNSIALEDVSFSVEPGEFVSVVGHSGAGKTTLVKMLLAEERPTKGEIFFEDQNISKIKSRHLYHLRRKIGAIFQDYKLIPSKTVYENMKRNAKMGNGAIVHKIIPEDLKYKVWEIEKEYHSNAAVYFLMDRSGSMDEDKKYIAKAMFFFISHFCKTKYKNVELIFIAHDTTAKIVPEKNFFSITNNGGTMCSSAFKLALEHIEENHAPEMWNNYVFEFSDGDNWGDDNKKCVEIVQKLLEVCSAVGYGEIDTNSLYGYSGFYSWSTLHDDLTKKIDHERFMTVKISDKKDIYDALKIFLQMENRQ